MSKTLELMNEERLNLYLKHHLNYSLELINNLTRKQKEIIVKFNGRSILNTFDFKAFIKKEKG